MEEEDCGRKIIERSMKLIRIESQITNLKLQKKKRMKFVPDESRAIIDSANWIDISNLKLTGYSIGIASINSFFAVSRHASKKQHRPPTLKSAYWNDYNKRSRLESIVNSALFIRTVSGTIANRSAIFINFYCSI